MSPLVAIQAQCHDSLAPADRLAAASESGHRPGSGPPPGPGPLLRPKLHNDETQYCCHRATA
eukprot:748888-Hanusia_phi.AAC.1